jgi:hypothetical protein
VKQITPQTINIVVMSKAHAQGVEEGFTCQWKYRIYGSGDIIIEVDLKDYRLYQDWAYNLLFLESTIHFSGMVVDLMRIMLIVRKVQP